MDGNIGCMELTRAYKFRIYPDATRKEEIDERLVLAQAFTCSLPVSRSGAQRRF